MFIERPDSGTYVGFEGPRGVGKTYMSKQLEERYGMETIPEKVPPGLGRIIYDGLTSIDDIYHRDGYPVVEALQFMSIRLVAMREYVIPLLEADETVIHDRTFYTTPVYTAVTHHLEDDSLSVEEYFSEYLELRSMLAFTPDVNLFFYDSLENCLERLESREMTEFSESEVEAMEMVHEYYPRLLEGRDDVHLFDLREYDDEEMYEEIAAVVSEAS